MAEFPKSGTPSLATKTPCPAHKVAGAVLAGEDLSSGDACTLRTVASVVYAFKASGALADRNADVYGFVATDADNGEPVTLYYDVVFHYGAGQVLPTLYYLSATNPGGLSTTATTGGTRPIAAARDATRIFVTRSVLR